MASVLPEPEHVAPLLDGDADAAESQRKAVSSTRSSFKHSLTSDKGDDRAKPFVVLVGITAALGGLIFGFDGAGSSATFVMPAFKEHFGWDTAPESQVSMQKGLINGLFTIGAALGALAAPPLFNSRGRKPTMACGASLFTVGATLQAAAVNAPMLIVPRLLSGAGIGMLSMCSPVYIAEVAPQSHRGQLGTLWQLAIAGGGLLVGVINIWLADLTYGWRISYGGNIVFAIALLLILTVMPESPQYLVTKGRHDDAPDALKKVRFEDQIEWEINELEMEAKEAEEKGDATWQEVFDNGNNNMKTRILFGALLQTIQQLGGINAIMFYAPNILEEFFGSKGGIIGSSALNAVNFFGIFLAMATIERFGRAFILFSGAMVMSIALMITAVLSSLEPSKEIGYGVTATCALYLIGFAYSWGPVVWVVCAEMFPLRERGKATSVTTFSNWFWATVLGFVFPVASAASLAGCFGFFAGVMAIAMLFVYFCLPETANRTAPEIDHEYETHKPQFPRKKWN